MTFSPSVLGVDEYRGWVSDYPGSAIESVEGPSYEFLWKIVCFVGSLMVTRGPSITESVTEMLRYARGKGNALRKGSCMIA